jgi:hypothetical protein
MFLCCIYLNLKYFTVGWFEIILILHVIGAAVGVGAAATNDSIFLSAIRNRLITKNQFVLIQAASMVVIGGLTLLTLTGILLMLHNPELWLMQHFRAKMSAVIVLMVNGLVFHSRLLPFLKSHLNITLSEEIIVKRQWYFAITGAVSGVSWFSVLIIAIVKETGFTYLQLMGIYVFLILLASVSGYFILSHLLFWSKKAKEEPPGKEQKPIKDKITIYLQIILLMLLLVSLFYIIFF